MITIKKINIWQQEQDIPFPLGKPFDSGEEDVD